MLSHFKSMDKLDKALFAAQLICWIEYLAILTGYAIVNPFADPIEVCIAVFLCSPVLVAYELMKSRLKEIKEPRITGSGSQRAFCFVVVVNEECEGGLMHAMAFGKRSGFSN
jgi:hypothetical protein